MTPQGRHRTEHFARKTREETQNSFDSDFLRKADGHQTKAPTINVESPSVAHKRKDGCPKSSYIAKAVSGVDLMSTDIWFISKSSSLHVSGLRFFHY